MQTHRRLMRAPLKCLAVSMLAALLSTHLFAATTNTSVEEVRTLARLYSAAFDRDPKTEGLNFWVRSYEDGRSVVDIAKDFYNSPEFIAKYGTLTNRGYVEQLFRNVLGREGASEGIEFWIGNLDSGTSRARVLSKFSDSPENIVKTSDTFDSMRFVDGQWQFGERVAAFCPDSACLQAQLNGSVGGGEYCYHPAADQRHAGHAGFLRPEQSGRCTGRERLEWLVRIRAAGIIGCLCCTRGPAITAVLAQCIRWR